MIDSHGVPERGMPMTVRSVFIIDPKKTIRLIMTYPASCGRNFNEIIRCLDSLQLYDKETLLTPASWYPGDPVIVPPSISTEKAKQMYGEDKVDEKKSYLRYVPNP
jgi:alkyl hydroperoxide reductase subunit AhpC